MKPRVVITGVGVLSCIGTGREQYWDALFHGKTGFGPITLFDTSSCPVHHGGEIRDFNPEEHLGRKGLRDLDRSTRLICSAAKLALEDSGFAIDDVSTHHMGVTVGATFGSLHSISQFDLAGLTEGPRYVNPSHFPNTVINSPASQISIRFNIKGFNTTISTGFCASLDALSYAADFIQLGRARAVLAGGVEELCEETFRGFSALGCLSGSDGTESQCCPFDMRRNGLLLSEGASVAVLEDESHAARKGSPILAEMLGYGTSFDPDSNKDFTHGGAGLRRAILRALDAAGLTPADVDYVSSCANSTRGLDRLEAHVIKEVFGDRSPRLPVSATKSMTGETFSASGGLSVAAAVGALQRGLVPPTMNYRERDPECDLDCVPNEAREKEIRVVLVTSVDPYGQNAAVVLGKYRR